MIAPETDILSLIPQKPPLVMVGQLISCNEVSSRTSFEINADNVFVENGQFTEAGLIENIAQTAAAGIGYTKHQQKAPISEGYIGAVKNLKIFDLPKVGDTIQTEIAIEDQVFDMIIITGKVMLNEIELAVCEMKIFTKS